MREKREEHAQIFEKAADWVSKVENDGIGTLSNTAHHGKGDDTMNITQLDKTTLRYIRDQINSTLAGSIENLEFHAGNCSYSGNIATFKLEVKVAGADSREMQDLKRYAGMYDIDLEKTYPVYLS